MHGRAGQAGRGGAPAWRGRLLCRGRLRTRAWGRVGPGLDWRAPVARNLTAPALRAIVAGGQADGVDRRRARPLFLWPAADRWPCFFWYLQEIEQLLLMQNATFTAVNARYPVPQVRAAASRSALYMEAARRCINQVGASMPRTGPRQAWQLSRRDDGSGCAVAHHSTPP